MNRWLTDKPMVRACVGGAAGVVLALAVWLPLGLREREPAWLTRLNHIVPTYTPQASGWMPPDAQAEQVRIFNDVLRRRVWTVNEVNDLATIVRRGYPASMNSGRRLNADELGRAMVHLAASVALIARLETNAPMTPEARAAAVDVLLDELEAEFPERRQHAAVALVATGLVRDPLVRARVERLLDDPDPSTVEVVALQLSYLDDRQRRASVLASGGKTGGKP